MYPIKSARLLTSSVILLLAATVALTGCDQATAPVEPNILEIMQQIPELSVVTGLLTEAELAETIATEGSITLFAPINTAFDDVDMTGISADDLRSILRYHVATTALPSWELTDGQVLATLQEENITVTIANNQGFVQNIQIIAVDGFGSNGVIHVIDGIMMPPSLTDDNGDDDDE